MLAPAKSPGTTCKPLSASNIRSVFISDVHLGSRFARAEAVCRFLQRYQPQYLYLVGDFVDARCLEKNWHWPPSYDILFRKLYWLASNGTQIAYTPGNHDDFLRHCVPGLEPLIVQDEIIHQCADGRRLIVMHGDQFDKVESNGRWLSHLGSHLYDLVLWNDRVLNDVLLRVGLPRIPISKFLKQTVKKVVQYVSGFESRVAAHAIANQCDGIVCGHIHVPKMTHLEEILYINVGDWIENCTALVEYEDGSLELLDYTGHLAEHDAQLSSLLKLSLKPFRNLATKFQGLHSGFCPTNW